MTDSIIRQALRLLDAPGMEKQLSREDVIRLLEIAFRAMQRPMFTHLNYLNLEELYDIITSINNHMITIPLAEKDSYHLVQKMDLKASKIISFCGYTRYLAYNSYYSYSRLDDFKKKNNPLRKHKTPLCETCFVTEYPKKMRVELTW